MHFSLKLVFFTLCCGIAMADLLEKEREIELKMQDMALRERGGSGDGASSSLNCLNYYLQLLGELTAEFQEKFKQCETNERKAKQQLDKSKEAELEEISECSTKACKRISNCAKSKGPLAQLECYTDIGAENAKIMFDISRDSAASAADLEYKYQKIENEKYKCTNATETDYLKESGKLIDEMNDCIRGTITIPTPKTTKRPSTTLPTTVKPKPKDSDSSIKSNFESSEEGLRYKLNDFFSQIKNKFNLLS